jgi:3'(2'), 5'-bisphosphate nucleotidase
MSCFNRRVVSNSAPLDRLPELASRVCALAHQAGEKIMRFYHNGASVTLKADASPLTAADEASHAFLVKSLQGLLPDVPVVSEESEGAMDRSIGHSTLFWLVDPLDGTKEFVKRTNEFTVNIALMEGQAAALGVVHAPAVNITYYGGREFGAWYRTGAEPPTRITTRRADSSQLAVVASKDHAGPLVDAMLACLTNPQLKSMGSSLKFCLVAEGAADLYLRDLPTMEWDTAAAQCVVEAAGGGVYSLDGQSLRYGKPGLKNPAIITVGDTRLDWRRLISNAAA